MSYPSPDRPVRPVERQPMKEWLIEKLDDGSIPGLSWVERHKIFKVKWCHGSRHGWSLKDVLLFEAWARHTGRYHSKANDPKRWKANFRCALNSLKDVEEVTGQSISKGMNAFRVYRIMESLDKPSRSRRGRRRSLKTPKTEEKCDLLIKLENKPMEDHTSRQVANQTPVTTNHSHNSHVPCPVVEPNIPSCAKQCKSALPKFEDLLSEYKIEYGKMHCMPRLNCGFTVHRGPTTPTLVGSPTLQSPLPASSPNTPDTPCEYEGYSDTLQSPQATTVVDDERSQYGYNTTYNTTFPETPEGSEEESQYETMDDGEFVQLSNVEVTVECTDSPYTDVTSGSLQDGDSPFTVSIHDTELTVTLRDTHPTLADLTTLATLATYPTTQLSTSQTPTVTAGVNQDWTNRLTPP